MRTIFFQTAGVVLFLSLLGGCASPERWVIVSVRDGLSRGPVEAPVIDIEPRGASLGSPTGPTTAQANRFGTARLKLATGQVKYKVTVDAADYDLYEFDLPNLDGFFPSGQWLKGKPTRKYQLRPDNVLELMVTLEP